jgi:hypothetical protein
MGEGWGGPLENFKKGTPPPIKNLPAQPAKIFKYVLAKIWGKIAKFGGKLQNLRGKQQNFYDFSQNF